MAALTAALRGSFDRLAAVWETFSGRVAPANMIPFPPEPGLVVAPDGRLLVALSAGPSTPISVPLDRLRADLARHGFDAFERVAAARGVALVARRWEMP